MINIYIHLITNGKKKNHEFERDWGREYRKIWKKERKKRNIVNKTQYQKFKTLVISCSGRFALVF